MLPTREPVILELNARVWLQSLASDRNAPLTLAQVPDEALDRLAGHGADLLWLMGVWTRSPRGREQALAYLPQYREALPDAQAEDVIGSAYAVHDWRVAPEAGGREALADFRLRLRERGMGLILDYVPNHVARDHAWLYRHPDWFIQGSEADLLARPGDFFATDTRLGPRIFAHGRDPWFPAWTDTAQVNVFNADYRRAVQEMVLDLAGQCDGLRCDMAMLLRNEVFATTWRDYLDVSNVPPDEFWQQLLPVVRERFPQFLFIAEVYWDMEADLIELGFDYCYDKTFYDALLHNDVGRIRPLLSAPFSCQRHLLRFTENHDERRAVAAFGEARSRAAFTLAAAAPGAFLLHDGQLEGRRVRLPVQLARQPDEPTLADHEDFQRRVLLELQAPPFREGCRQHFDVTPLNDGDGRHAGLIALGRACPDDCGLVVVNHATEPGCGRVSLQAWPQLAAGNWRLEERIGGACQVRKGEALLRDGLELALPPWGAQILRLRRA